MHAAQACAEWMYVSIARKNSSMKTPTYLVLAVRIAELGVILALFIIGLLFLYEGKAYVAADLILRLGHTVKGNTE